MKVTRLAFGIVSAALLGSASGARLADRLAGVHESFLENRREALPSLSDPYGVPDAARVVIEKSHDSMRDSLPWKRNVVATVFWIGELPTEHNPTPNTQSAWDQNWQENFGGYDQPDAPFRLSPRGLHAVAQSLLRRASLQ